MPNRWPDLLNRIRSSWGDPPDLIVLGAWLILQLFALTISAVPLTLSRVDPRPLEQLAVPILLTIQLFGAALLFPRLCQTPRTMLLADLSAAAMLQLAALLAGQTLPGLLTATALLWMALAILSLIHPWLTRPAQTRAAAFLTGWLALTPLVMMAQLNQQAVLGPMLFLPLNLAIAQSATPNPLFGLWISLAVLIVLLAANIARTLLASERR